MRQDRKIGDPHGLERAELAQILEHEDVEGLADHCGADDEPQCHGDAEIDWYAGSLEVIADRGPGKLAPGQSLEPSLASDPLRQLMRIDTGPRVDQYKGTDVYVVNTCRETPLPPSRSAPGADPLGIGDSVGGGCGRALVAGSSPACRSVGDGPLSSFRGQGSATCGCRRIRLPGACRPADSGMCNGC